MYNTFDGKLVSGGVVTGAIHLADILPQNDWPDLTDGTLVWTV